MIAFPVNSDRGLWSTISPHFGKAEGFIVVDLETEKFEFFDTNKLRQSGDCAPFGALSRMGVNELFCRSLGKAALDRCEEAGIQVLPMEAETVTDGILERSKSLGPDAPKVVLCRKACKAEDGCDEKGNCCQ